MKGIWTVEETATSDHRPKIIQIKTGQKKWMRNNKNAWSNHIDHEVLRYDKVEEYKIRTKEECRQKREELEENCTNWNITVEIITSAARETGGLKRKKM